MIQALYSASICPMIERMSSNRAPCLELHSEEVLELSLTLWWAVGHPQDGGRKGLPGPPLQSDYP